MFLSLKIIQIEVTNKNKKVTKNNTFLFVEVRQYKYKIKTTREGLKVNCTISNDVVRAIIMKKTNENNSSVVAFSNISVFL